MVEHFAEQKVREEGSQHGDAILSAAKDLVFSAVQWNSQEGPSLALRMTSLVLARLKALLG
jgi:hypothetical protein